MPKRCWAGFVLLLMSCACGAEPAANPPTSLTIEQILAVRSVRAPLWSPDGQEVGFTWGSGVDNSLWAAGASAAGPGAPGAAILRQLAPLAGRGSAALSPDWRSVAYVAKKHVWTVPLAGGRPQRLTADEADYGGLNWSPDASRIAFVVDDGAQTDVGVVAADGSGTTLIAATDRDEDSPIWSPDSSRLAFIRRFADWQGYDVWTSTPDGKTQRKILTESYERGVEEYRFGGNTNWSPDGRHLVYLSSRAGYNHIWTVPVEGGEPSPVTTGEFVDYDPVWSPDGRRIVFVSSRTNQREERHIWVVDAGGGTPVRLSPDGFSANPVWSPDSRRVAYLLSTATQPPELVVQAAEPSASPVQLTVSQDEPPVGSAFVQPEAVSYSSSGGVQVPAVLLRPRGAAGESRPAIMYFHGKGGINLLGWGGLSHYAFHQLLVQQGYAVLFVNWRGTHVGYGAEFERANYRDYAGGELDDVKAGAEFLVREVGVDAERIACWGSSYGGYMTMLAITRAPDLCRAGVALYGVSDWTAFTKQNQRRLWNYRLYSKLGRPDEHPELYERAAAIRYVNDARAPLLILQGTDDDGVVPAQGESLFDEMQKAGKTVEYVAFTGEGHGFRQLGSQRDLYQRVLTFLDAHNGRLPGPEMP
jgi:dipeptidyl aminopeptidase/acylaminoacyl peptidase